MKDSFTGRDIKPSQVVVAICNSKNIMTLGKVLEVIDKETVEVLSYGGAVLPFTKGDCIVILVEDIGEQQVSDVFSPAIAEAMTNNIFAISNIHRSLSKGLNNLSSETRQAVFETMRF